MSYETRYAARMHQAFMNRPFVPPDPNRLVTCPLCERDLPLPEYDEHTPSCIAKFKQERGLSA